MKKIGLILMSMFVVASVFQSCQDDITDLADPREAFVKSWRTTDSENPNADYDVNISSNTTESTKVWIDNFHNLGVGTKISATLAGSILTITNEIIDEEYTILGTGIITDNLENINWVYSVTDDDGTDDFTARSGEQVPVKKKKFMASL